MRLLPRRSDRDLRCREVGRVLQQFLDDEIDDRTAARVADHLDACRDCGLDADAYREMKAALMRSVSGIPPESARRLRLFVERLAEQDVPPGAP